MPVPTDDKYLSKQSFMCERRNVSETYEIL
jgi:hypothetical protein